MDNTKGTPIIIGPPTVVNRIIIKKGTNDSKKEFQILIEVNDTSTLLPTIPITFTFYNWQRTPLGERCDYPKNQKDIHFDFSLNKNPNLPEHQVEFNGFEQFSFGEGEGEGIVYHVNLRSDIICMEDVNVEIQ